MSARVWEREGVEPVRVSDMAAAEQYVAGCLGDWGDDYDVPSIASECFEFDSAMDEFGTVHLDRQCFRLAATTSEFWESVERHETGH